MHTTHESEEKPSYPPMYNCNIPRKRLYISFRYSFALDIVLLSVIKCKMKSKKARKKLLPDQGNL